MSSRHIAAAVFIWVVVSVSCGKPPGEPSKSNPGGKHVSNANSTYDPLGDPAGPAVEPGTAKPVKVGRMDKVMEVVDQKLSNVRYASYMRFRYRRGVKPKKKDKSNAPFFHTPGKKGAGVENLPLKSTSADVKIAGVIAHVKVRQVYKNQGKKPIEAVYVFPGSTRAAVHGMRMKIGERVIEAKIKERKQARQTYDAAKRAGQRASLLEQQRPNVFTMNVANIMPGDVIQVELDYTELVVPEDGVYEFVYPTVVGPRYVGPESPKESWTANPHLTQGKKEPYKFGFKLHLESPIGIKDLTSSSHKVDVKWKSKNSADVTLAKEGGGNRDVVVRYRLAGDKIETGVMLFEGAKEKFFLLMMEPPKRVTKAQLPRREYIFVVDVSGSMYGFPLNTAKALMKKLFKVLTPKDYFNVVLFAGGSTVMHPKSLPATGENLARAIAVIERQRGGGGTQLMGALRTALTLPKIKARGVSRTVAIITDGYVSVEAKAFRYIRKNLGKGNVFAFGIGSSVNRGLIEGVARAGMGEPFVVLSPTEAEPQADKFKKYIQSPVLTDIEVSYKGLKTYDVVPKSPPDLMALRPLIVFGKYRGTVAGAIHVNGYTGKGRFKKAMPVVAAMSKPLNKPLRVLWARKWVEILMDQLTVLRQDADLKQAVTNVGLSYKLLTRFTSFVAVDTRKVRKQGKLVTVRQPLPLPQGVSNYAVGGRPAGGVRYRRRPVYAGRGPYSRGVGRATRGTAKSAPTSSPSAAETSADPLAALAGRKTKAAGDSAARPDARLKHGRTVSVSVAGMTNVSGRHKSRVRWMIVRTLGRSACMAKFARTSRTVTVTVDSSGKITVSGPGSVSRCVKKALAWLSSLLKRAGSRTDFSKKVVIRIKLGR